MKKLIYIIIICLLFIGCSKETIIEFTRGKVISIERSYNTWYGSYTNVKLDNGADLMLGGIVSIPSKDIIIYKTQNEYIITSIKENK